jgi:hypothetical protein
MKWKDKIFLSKIVFEKPAIHRSSTNEISIELLQQISIVPMVCNNLEWSQPKVIKLSMLPLSSFLASHFSTKSSTLKSSSFVFRRRLSSNSWFYQKISDPRRRFPTGSKHNSSG